MGSLPKRTKDIPRMFLVYDPHNIPNLWDETLENAHVVEEEFQRMVDKMQEKVPSNVRDDDQVAAKKSEQNDDVQMKHVDHVETTAKVEVDESSQQEQPAGPAEPDADVKLETELKAERLALLDKKELGLNPPKKKDLDDRVSSENGTALRRVDGKTQGTAYSKRTGIPFGSDSDSDSYVKASPKKKRKVAGHNAAVKKPRKRSATVAGMDGSEAPMRGNKRSKKQSGGRSYCCVM
jgi:ATP-dependent Clp protease ATP-binding subunit ClpA